MKRLWDGLDVGTSTTTSQEDESNGDEDRGNEDSGDDSPGRSEQAKGAHSEEGAHPDAMRGGKAGDDSNGAEQQNEKDAARSSTLLGLPEGADAGEVILVNKRDIMVLQFVIVRLVEKDILDAEEVMRMKKNANQQIRESHPDVIKK